MYDVKLNLCIPIVVQNVESDSYFDAADKVQNLIYKTLPLLIADNFETVKNEMTIVLDEIKEVENARS